MRVTKHLPPQLAKAFLRRFCHVSFIEEVEGDLDEQFYENVEEMGLRRARRQYWYDVVRACLSGNRREENSVSRMLLGDSLSHFFKIFFRGLRHGRASASINITGLVLSLVSFIVIWLYVNDELSYDEFHPDAQQVYRISHSYKRYGDGVPQTDARLPGLWVQALRELSPEIKASTRFSKFGMPGSMKYEKKDLLFEEPDVYWVDPDYTAIFSLELIKGDTPDKVFKDPSKIIINKSAAEKYFTDEDPLGKEIIYSRQGMDFHFTVAGVMKDYPNNAHFHPAFIAGNISLDPLWKRNGNDRVNSNGDPFTYTFIRVDNEAELAKVASILDPLVKKQSNDAVTAVFTKLTDIHFTHGMDVTLEAPGDKAYVYISASTGILILIIAAINYMNLATARSVRRSKEVGLRKTLGVRRSSLAGQFLGESMMIILISFVISIGLTILLLPFFNQLTGKSFTSISLIHGDTLLILSSLVIVLALLSGSYPAFYLSRFKPVDVLKNKVSGGNNAERFRKALVVFQFTITMALIVCAAVIRTQLSYIRESKLASNTDRVITVRNQMDSNIRSMKEFKSRLMQTRGVEQVSLSDHLPRRDGFSFITLPVSIKSKGADEYVWDALKVDEDFVDMFKIELVAGRNFSPSQPLDTTNVILNEAAVRALNMTPEEAVGQEMSVNPNIGLPYKTGKVIGVVKDFPYESVRFKISPMFLFGYYPNAETINIKVSGDDLQATIEHIAKVWRNTNPSVPFEYWFMDQEFGKLYKQEIRMAKLSNYFTGFTVLIACLGLFGLASFTIEQKTKEIGIRKVMGASARQILVLLTNRFVLLVVIACILAIPLSLYAMDLWLQNFVYRASIHWTVFAGAGMFILILTYLTVGIESLRAANANPVESIRHE